jgi:hypothetical protein
MKHIVASKKKLARYEQQCNDAGRKCEFKSLPFYGGSTRLGEAICDLGKSLNASSIVVGSRGLTSTQR